MTGDGPNGTGQTRTGDRPRTVSPPSVETGLLVNGTPPQTGAWQNQTGPKRARYAGGDRNHRQGPNAHQKRGKSQDWSRNHEDPLERETDPSDGEKNPSQSTKRTSGTWSASRSGWRNPRQQTCPAFPSSVPLDLGAEPQIHRYRSEKQSWSQAWSRKREP